MTNAGFVFDRISIFLTITFLFIGFISFLYALATIRQKGHRLEYYLMLFLIVLSGVGTAITTNLLWIFIFWEISTFAVWRAVVYYRQPEQISSGNVVFITNFVAAGLLLVGIGILYLDNNSLIVTEIKNFNISAVILITIGIFAKSVILPLYFWLVPAYASIPSAIGGSLAGIAENIGLIMFYRLFVNNPGIPENYFLIVGYFAVVSSLITGGSAYITNRLRYLLAYSTISQIGFILLGFSAGGFFGTYGAIAYILAHALAKSGLFYGVGTIEDITGEANIKNISCMLKVSPVLTVMMALLFSSLVGFFPMIGFFAKLMVVIGSVQKNILFGFFAIASAIFTLLYSDRFYHELFYGEKCDIREIKLEKKPGLIEIGVVFILTVLSLILGVSFYEILTFIGGI
ncbi:MAG: complex I subunit 5 family protein [candidate division WOR-3 bacterium]|nr:complex I subunit 5 family protein [candidate division WOR-3 bacterium]